MYQCIRNQPTATHLSMFVTSAQKSLKCHIVIVKNSEVMSFQEMICGNKESAVLGLLTKKKISKTKTVSAGMVKTV